MGSLRSRDKLFVGGALTALSLVALTTASAQHSPRQPDFSSDQVGWIATNPDFIAVPGGPSPTRSDPAHPYVPNGTGAQPTFRVADLANPAVDPRDTSRSCPECGVVDKASRKAQSEFSCVHCGHQAAADFVGALNIRSKGVRALGVALVISAPEALRVVEPREMLPSGGEGESSRLSALR
jgi:ribosomal protein L37AE/L43A